MILFLSPQENALAYIVLKKCDPDFFYYKNPLLSLAMNKLSSHR